MTATQTLAEVRGTGPYLASGEQEKRTKRRNRRIALALVIPGIAGLAVSFLFPLVYMIRMAFNEGSGNGIVVETFTFSTILDPLTDSYYWKVTADTFLMGLVVGVLCIVVSYPIALFLARTQSKWMGLLLAAALAPLLTSAVVRTYGWMVLLGDDGLVNSTLLGIGLIDSPIRMANSMSGVIIGLVEIFMPYAILAMISGFGRISTQLEEAAGSLGANKAKVFFRITLPLSLPGVLTAFLLVFVLSISTFVTPRLLGGGVVQVLATEIYDQATGLLNWPFAAALAIILLVLFGAVISVYQALIKKIGG
ncbi:MAG TPA: ABC transporter permease [Candidatus Microbacterium stercoravium]|uniref:ABC transporter permease n=1 Tax=Candidatus Microbacterium stercoravium TaxID=2838697 RepID=A0A9D2KGT0_9MICO|nr:ABC transporter permease [Candidatus Microbacterium stercoravium]